MRKEKAYKNTHYSKDEEKKIKHTHTQINSMERKQSFKWVLMRRKINMKARKMRIKQHEN